MAFYIFNLLVFQTNFLYYYNKYNLMCPFFISDYKVLCCYLPLSISSLSSSLLRKGDFMAAPETKRLFHTSTVFMVGIPDCAQQNKKNSLVLLRSWLENYKLDP